MKRKISRRTSILAPVEYVFDLIQQPESRKLWQKGLVKTVYTYVPDGDTRIGTRFVAHIREGGRVREYPGELIAFEPGFLISIRHASPQFTMESTYAVTSEQENSQVEFVTLVTFTSPLAKIMSPIARFSLGLIMGRQLSALKRVAEKTPNDPID